MKINTPKSIDKRILYIALPIAVLFLAYGVVAYVNNIYPFSKNSVDTIGITKNTQEDNINYDKPTDSQQQAGEEQKKYTATRIQDLSTPTTEASALGVTITAFNQNDNTIQIRNSINVIDNDGTCELVLTKGDTRIEKSSNTQALPTESTCMGFDIPVSELSPGEWQATITVTAQARIGSAVKIFMVK